MEDSIIEVLCIVKEALLKERVKSCDERLHDLMVANLDKVIIERMEYIRRFRHRHHHHHPKVSRIKSVDFLLL